MNIRQSIVRSLAMMFLPCYVMAHASVQDVESMVDKTAQKFRDKFRLLCFGFVFLSLSGCEPETMGGPGAIYQSGGNPPPVVVPELTPDHPDFAETIYGTKVTGRFTAKMVGVTPGLSLTLLTKGNQQIKLRFESLIALDENPAANQLAKAKLTKMLIGRTVEVAMTRKEQGVSLGWVFVAGQNINEMLVENGLARVNPSNHDSDFKELETLAKAKQLGLWAEAND